MNQLNSIILEGNLVKDPDFKENAGKTGANAASFTIGVNRKSKTPSGETIDEVSYFDVETWGAMADNIKKFAKKGQGVRVVGRLKQDVWEDNGVKKSRIKVVAEHVEYKFGQKVEKTAAPKKKSKDDDYGRGM